MSKQGRTRHTPKCLDRAVNRVWANLEGQPRYDRYGDELGVYDHRSQCVDIAPHWLDGDTVTCVCGIDVDAMGEVHRIMRERAETDGRDGYSLGLAAQHFAFDRDAPTLIWSDRVEVTMTYDGAEIEFGSDDSPRERVTIANAGPEQAELVAVGLELALSIAQDERRQAAVRANDAARFHSSRP